MGTAFTIASVILSNCVKSEIESLRKELKIEIIDEVSKLLIAIIKSKIVTATEALQNGHQHTARYLYLESLNLIDILLRDGTIDKWTKDKNKSSLRLLYSIFHVYKLVRISFLNVRKLNDIRAYNLKLKEFKESLNLIADKIYRKRFSFVFFLGGTLDSNLFLFTDNFNGYKEL